MSAPALVAPPIRVCLEDMYSRAAGGRNDPPATTEKTWYLYWQSLGDRLTGLVGYGRADERPDAGSVPDGGLYMQIDPGYVIYQSIAGEWHYVAGTMYGTIVPDQRPTGMGPNDAGFDFRAIDTDTQYSGREFIWSGSRWVEATPVRYNTHAQRLATPIASIVNGMLWVEVDRSGVIYQNQDLAWHFLAGTMWGTLTPDQRPTDLGVNDAGFTFRGTDVARSFVWSGSAWVETTPTPPTLANFAVLATASAGLTLTTSAQAIPGTTITLTRAGVYLIQGVFYMTLAQADAGSTLVGQFSGNTGSVAVLADFITGGTTLVQVSATITQQWLFTATAGQVVSLQAFKSGGAGASSVAANHTSISALWVSP